MEFDPLIRLTNSDVVHLLAAQLPEWFRPSEFFPAPCCFPTCRSITYMLVDGDTVVPIPWLLHLEDHLDYVSNRVLPDAAVRAALEKLWSASATPGTPSNAAQLECATCGLDLPQVVKDVSERAFMTAWRSPGGSPTGSACTPASGCSMSRAARVRPPCCWPASGA